MKYRIDRQMVTLEAFNQEAWRVVRVNAYGYYLLPNGVSLVVFHLMGVPLVWGMAVGLFFSGLMFIVGSSHVSEQTKIWVEHMMVFRETQEEEETEVSTLPIKENASVKLITTNSGIEEPFEVFITHEQLKDVIEVMFYDTYLTRSSLNADVWPGLTEKWRDKTIQRKLMSMGLITESNTFTVGEAGSVGRLEVERDKLASRLRSVGGSDG